MVIIINRRKQMKFNLTMVGVVLVFLVAACGGDPLNRGIGNNQCKEISR